MYRRQEEDTMTHTAPNIRHDLSSIWEPPSVEQAERELREAERAYDANPGPTTQAALHDAIANFDDATEGDSMTKQRDARPPTIELPTSPGGYHFDGVSTDEPCAVCGKEVAHPAAHVLVVCGGGRIARPEDEAWFIEHDPGYIGGLAVGSTCVRRIPPEYRA